MTQPISTERRRLSVGAGAATFTVALVGLLAANLSPLMLLALDGIGVPPVEAGGIMTAHLLATAVAALVSMRWVEGGARRLIARTGTAAATIGFGIAAFLPSAGVPLVASLVVAGLGAGAAASAGGAALAAFQGSNRVVGFNVLFNRGANAILLAVVPAIALSMVSVFGAAALVCAIAFAVVAGMPPAAASDAPVLDAVGVERHNPAEASSRLLTVCGAGLLACFGLWALSEDSLWAIAGVMGAEQSGLDEALLGLVLSLSTVGGLLGALLVVVTGPRLPRSWALLAMLVLGGTLKLASAFATDPVVYAALLIAWNFFYGIAYTYFIATAAGLDARGRWSGPIVGAYLVGSSFAPLFATWVSGLVGYAGFGLVIGAISVLLAIPVVAIARVSMRAEAAIDDVAGERAANEVSQ